MSVLSKNPDGAFVRGHVFCDRIHGIDHERCGNCRLSRRVFEREPKNCALPLEYDQIAASNFRLNFSDLWNIAPELNNIDIYSKLPCPDAIRFSSPDELLDYLDTPLNRPRDQYVRGVGDVRAETRRKQRSWIRLVSCSLAHFNGSAYNGPSFAAFLAVRALEPWPMADTAIEHIKDRLRRISQRGDPVVSFCLKPDWRFEEIEQAAVRMPGHEFAGLRLESFSHQIGAMISDLQTASMQLHPFMSAEALAIFLESWEVERHTAEFCGKVLANSLEANRLIKAAGKDSFGPTSYIESSRQAVRIQLAVYCANLRLDVSRSAASPVTEQASENADHGRDIRHRDSPLRAHRLRILKAYMATQQLEDMSAVGRRVGACRSALYGMVNGDRFRYSEEKLTAVLAKIGCSRRKWDRVAEPSSDA